MSEPPLPPRTAIKTKNFNPRMQKARDVEPSTTARKSLKAVIRVMDNKTPNE